VSLAIIKQGQIPVQRRACVIEISVGGDLKLGKLRPDCCFLLEGW